jgi:hypothetical protein
VTPGTGWLKVVVAAVLIPLPAAEGEESAPQELRWRLKAGETLHYTRESDRVMTILGGEQPFKQNTRRTIELTWRVQKVEPDGSARIVETIDRIRHSIKNPREELVFDSAKRVAPAQGTAAAIAAGIKPLVGAEFSFALTPLGEVHDVTLSEKTRQAIASAPPAAGAALRETALTFLIPALPLPEAAAKPGASWTEKASFADPMFGTRNLTRTFRYYGGRIRDGKKLAEIGVEVESVVTPPKDAPVRFEVKSMTTRGTISFDVASGRLVERSDKETARMNMINAGKTTEQVLEGTETTTLAPNSKAPSP